MHRARVTEERGKKVLAEGKWLTVIGNRSAHSGDWVWTDGRCIYGHESAGGSATVLAKRGESGVPIYVGGWHCIYQRGELRRLLGLPASYKGLLYLGAHAAHLLPHPYPRGKRQLLDADMDAYGNIFTLTGVYWTLDEDGMWPGVLGAVRAEKNGEEIASHDLKTVLRGIEKCHVHKHHYRRRAYRLRRELGLLFGNRCLHRRRI